jgi:hypothetical protein
VGAFGKDGRVDTRFEERGTASEVEVEAMAKERRRRGEWTLHIFYPHEPEKKVLNLTQLEIVQAKSLKFVPRPGNVAVLVALDDANVGRRNNIQIHAPAPHVKRAMSFVFSIRAMISVLPSQN